MTNWLTVFGRRVKARLEGRTLEQDFRDEVEFHLAMREEQLRGAGLDDARDRAQRKFGNATRIREALRETWALALPGTGIARDVRYALRALRTNPGFSITAILTLALAIGANSAMFSVLNGLILRPLAVADPNRVVMVWRERPAQGVREGRAAYLTVEDWRRQSTSLADIAFFDPGSAMLTSGADPERISIARVSPNLFSLLGVPIRGRSFSSEEADAQQPLALISRRFWQTRFAGADSVIGTSIGIDGRLTTIIGIIPADLELAQADVWEPHTRVPGWDVLRQARGTGPWFVVGRLRPDVTLELARTEMAAVSRRLEAANGAADAGVGIGLVPIERYVVGDRPRLALWMLGGSVFFVLLIAATNVAGLTLARSAGREREIAIRAAIGASRVRIVRQLLIESLTLAAVAGALGLLLGVGLLHLIVAIAPPGLPRLDQVGLDARTLGWTVLLCVVTTMVTGLAPALTTARRSLSTATREGGRGVAGGATSRRIRRVLVRAELALAIVLLVGAGLLIRSLWSIANVNPGFSANRVLSVQVASQRGPAERVDLYLRILEQIARLPGVEQVGMTGDLIISGGSDVNVTSEGDAVAVSTRLPIRRDEASPDFFATLEVPVLSGRAFSPADGRGEPLVAIVNDTLARRLWPSGPAVGRRFKLAARDINAPWFTVVGVVADMRRQGQEIPAVAQMFEPLAQNSSRLATLLVRTSREDPTTMAGMVRGAIRQVDGQSPIYGISSLDQHLGAMGALRRFQTFLLIAFSGIALLLAAIGTYGLIHYSVSTRTQEIAVRMAMGAESRGIFRMVIREGLLLSLPGLAIGLAGALAIGRLGSSLLFGVTATDPWTLLTVSGLLLAVAALACYVPARRAMNIDPVAALRKG